MKETKLFAKMQPYLSAWGEYDRVENIHGSGMPDIHFCINSNAGWIETKVAKGDFLYFEKFQPGWARRYLRSGFHRLWVAAQLKDESFALYRYSVIVRAPMQPKNDWLLVNVNDIAPTFRMPSPYRSWKSVRDTLIS